MKFALALVTVATIALAPAANAADASLTDCLKVAKEVSTALSTAQPGENTDAARRFAGNGRVFCGSQMYTKGVAHYTRALELLTKN